MKKLNAKIAGLVLAAALVFGVTISNVESVHAATETTMSVLVSAAQQLDATTQSGGPTAAQNQKIQELTFNLQQMQQTLNRTTN